MRWIILISLSLLILQTFADPNPVPEPKKYRPEKNEKPYKISEEERKFIKEIESKYNINQGNASDDDEDSEENTSKEKDDSEVGDSDSQEDGDKPFPAVIAIEIVNDTIVEGKGKRTVDANLGYGYRTNKGYTYTYLGKPKEEQGKFMIYPYSQEDIPAAPTTFIKNNGRHKTQSRHRTKSSNVEIQPSKAYELVPVTEEQTSYGNERAVSEVHTDYEHVTGIESPPPPQSSIHYQDGKPQITSTLFTTYNQGKISGLSGHFPSVMPNYFIDSSQLLSDPHFQNVGITPDHLRQHGESLSQRVVPVLILRVPSSHIQNPTAELYPNLPQNYPYSNHLNNINLQALVAQYLRKHGYTHQAPEPSEAYGVPLAPSIKNYPIHYTAPATKNPSYTHTNFGGVQYSAVQPVMAKYPSINSDVSTQYYSVPETSQGAHETEYRYVQGSTVMAEDGAHSLNQHSGNPIYQHYLQQESIVQNSPYQVQQEEVSQTDYVNHEARQQLSHSPSKMYLPISQHSSAGVHVHQPSSYELPAKTDLNLSHTRHGLSQATQTHSYQNGATHHFKVHHDIPAVQTPEQQMYVTYAAPSHQTQQPNIYQYVQQIENSSDDKDLPISENYPSKDHTQIKILPKGVAKQSKIPVQQITYVTPSPSQNKLHPYRMMAPQSVLGYKSGVSYINSHSLPQGQYTQEYLNPEKEHTAEISYIPPVGSQKPPSYPRNYHAHGNKRMTKAENKTRVQGVRKTVSIDKQTSNQKS